MFITIQGKDLNKSFVFSFVFVYLGFLWLNKKKQGWGWGREKNGNYKINLDSVFIMICFVSEFLKVFMMLGYLGECREIRLQYFCLNDGINKIYILVCLVFFIFQC